MYRTLRAVPPELEGKIDQDTFDKSRLYQLDKSTFSLLLGFFKELEFLVGSLRPLSIFELCHETIFGLFAHILFQPILVQMVNF